MKTLKISKFELLCLLKKNKQSYLFFYGKINILQLIRIHILTFTILMWLYRKL